ncbi:hypothetical protein J4232_02185 [Candidatus Woesearchaeota archaeon]|nr:hypothetical protein [Candidatus Woesearchaeota archaeon]
MELIISNCIGVFVLRDKQIIDKVLYKSIAEMKNASRYESQFLQKYHSAKTNVSYVFPKTKEFVKRFYEANVVLTRNDLKNAIGKDQIIIHCINSIDELNKAINLLVRRLREWYSLYFPELDHKLSNNEAFARLVFSKNKETLLREYNLYDSIGGKMSEDDIAIIQQFAQKISYLIQQKEENEKYLEKTLSDYCPNLQAVANTLLASQFIAHTGSLGRLAEYPSSTIQILGAEKALFRHMKTKAAAPKHGIIINHPLIAAAKAKEHGKIARHVAAAISIAVRVDYFNGSKTVGKELRAKLERQFGKHGE